MTPLHRRLIELLGEHSTEDVFAPEISAGILESPEGRRLVALVEGLGARDAVLAALRAVAAERDAREAEVLDIQLVATMPGFRSAVARDTEEAVLEMVKGSVRHLIVVGYELTSQPFEAELHAASDRGVEIVIVADRRSQHDLPPAWRTPRIARQCAGVFDEEEEQQAGKASPSVVHV